MAKVSKLEMAPQVLNHSNITIQKSLLGEKVILLHLKKWTLEGRKMKESCYLCVDS